MAALVSMVGAVVLREALGADDAEVGPGDDDAVLVARDADTVARQGCRTARGASAATTPKATRYDRRRVGVRGEVGADHAADFAEPATYRFLRGEAEVQSCVDRGNEVQELEILGELSDHQLGRKDGDTVYVPRVRQRGPAARDIQPGTFGPLLERLSGCQQGQPARHERRPQTVDGSGGQMAVARPHGKFRCHGSGSADEFVRCSGGDIAAVAHASPADSFERPSRHTVGRAVLPSYRVRHGRTRSAPGPPG